MNEKNQIVTGDSSIKTVEKLGYGLGDFASNLIWTSMGMYLMFFYTDVAGIAAGVIGTIMLISRVFDGITDVGMGILIDKTKSKHGKARFWILWMAVPFALSAVLLFSVPEVGMTGKVIFVIFTYNLVSILFTSINIPYGVLNSLFTQNQYERSVLNLYRMIFAMGGTLLISVVTLPSVNAFGGDKFGWQVTYAIYGVIAIIFFWITFLTTKERVQAVNKPSTEIPVKVGLKALLKNKYWMIVLIFFVTSYISQTALTGSAIYFAQYTLGNQSYTILLQLAIILPMMISMMFLAPLIKRFGKRTSMVFGLLIFLLGSAVSLLSPTNATLVLIGTVIRGIGYAPVSGSIFALLADTIEYGEWKTGVRTEGLIYSAGSLGHKFGVGIGSALTGWMLAWGGYVGGAEVQQESAIVSINALFIYLPLIVSILQLIILSFYKLDKEYPKILKDLQDRAA